jgi:dephospho-CoA kinase
VTLHVALTGNAAAGKSSVAELFRAWGATIIDADAVVRDLQRPGTPVFERIRARFGPGIVAADGGLDRAALRRRVFGDAAALADLNAIVHPAVRVERERRLADARAAGAAIVIDDIPLLFEVMDPAVFDAVILVDAPVDVRRARLMADRGLQQDEADRLIAAQLPAASKRGRSTYVIDNDSDRTALERAARGVWDSLQTLPPR